MYMQLILHSTPTFDSLNKKPKASELDQYL